MSFEPMAKGAHGEHAADLNGRLVFLGFLHPPVGHTFDDHTETALHHYQAAVGHPATGVVDEALWQQLCADTDSSGYSLQQALAGGYNHNADPTTVTEHTDYRTIDLRNILNGLARDVNSLAGHHALGIGSACQYFEAYATTRLPQVGHYTGSDYLKYLTRHLTSEAGIKLTGILTAGLAAGGVGAIATFGITSLWIGFSMTVERVMGNAAKDALADKDDLGKAIPGMVAAISGAVMTEYGELEQQFKAEIDRIINDLNHNVPLDDYTAHWLEPLLTAGPSGNEHFIKSALGIPTEREAVRDGVYHLLVAAFEEMVLGTTEYRPTVFEAAAASALGGARGMSGEEMMKASQDEKHRRAEHAADEASKKLPHSQQPQHH